MLESGERIWLIGGTSESVLLARALISNGLPCSVSVTTASAKALYPQTSSLRVRVGCLDEKGLEQFLQEELISAVLDASHPYALEISRMAIAVASSQQIPYLRFERPAVDRSLVEGEQAIQLDNFETLLAGNYLYKRRVLLTVGYKALPLFSHWQQRSSLFARILPSLKSLEVATAAGFSSNQLIALRPPITAELERALWHQWNISMVVTKASGVAGGEDVKRVVAAELGIPLIVIARPVIDYPQKTSDLSVALEFCQSHLK
ncbi:MAG: cobalt-precorrin-6A reductase [Symploca sp. SIO2B6]|nr:cobalt-precorrin-6A reductase [Symploca sp. SIO2B6]